MKIKKTKVSGTPANRVLNAKEIIQFEIVQAIETKHFKKLMQISRLYTQPKKTGYIKPGHESEANKLFAEIESSNSSAAEKSYQKAKEKKSRQLNSATCQHEDLGSRGYKHGTTVVCPDCGQLAEVW